jgi:type IV pilus assembly protein PilA
MAYTAERLFYQEKDRYSPYVADVGFAPERNNRYAYRTQAGGAISDRSGTATLSGPADVAIQADTYKFVNADPEPTYTPGGTGAAAAATTDSAFSATAAGDVDSDAADDSWHIQDITSSFAHDCGNASETAEPGGTPVNSYNDVSCE